MEIISNASSHMFDSEHNYSKYEIHVTLNMLLFYNKHLGFVTFRGPSLYRGKKLTCTSKMMSVIQQKKLMPTHMFNNKERRKCKYWSFQDTSFSCEQ